jgi:hypothetical protein
MRLTVKHINDQVGHDDDCYPRSRAASCCH